MIDPATRASKRMAGTGQCPPNPDVNGTYTRFLATTPYGNGWDGMIVLINDTTAEPYFLRVAESTRN
jgi:hypothetical protein